MEVRQAQRVTPHDLQVELERWCTQIGGNRAVSGKWQAGAQGFLTQQFASAYLDVVLRRAKEARTSARRGGHLWHLLQGETGIKKVGLETLVYVLSNMKDGTSRNKVAAAIGKRAEFVLFLEHPYWKNSRHLDALRLVNGRALPMDLFRKRLIKLGIQKAPGSFQALTPVERVALGTLFLEIIANCTGLIRMEAETLRPGRTAITVRFTEPYWNFLKNWKKNLLAFRPAYLPMTVVPKDWSKLTDGGYLTTITPLTSVSWERWGAISKNLHPCVMGSINTLQRQTFRKNREQVELQEECWELGIGVGQLPPRDRLEKPHRKQHETGDYWKLFWQWRADQRKNAIRTRFIHSLVGWKRLEEFDRFWFVWHMDFRGRLYQRGSQINYLGSDPFRTQLELKEGGLVRGHEKELYWAIGDALGISPDWERRTEWVLQNMEQIVAAGENPLNYRAFWEGAKSPWRFIQLCTELAFYSEDENHRSHAVYQLDQTCSGYGHVACLLRSGWLAAATNVTGNGHADLYTLVAERVGEFMNAEERIPPLRMHEDYCVGWWKDHGIPRSLMKTCVMPVIYRRSYQSMVDGILEYLRDEVVDFRDDNGVRLVDIAHTLGKYISLAVKDCIPGAHQLHKWLVEVASLQMKHKRRPTWVTPNGLVVESYSNWRAREVYRLQVAGKLLKIDVADTTKTTVDKRRSVSQLSADFVHSQDAAFIQRFIWHWGQGLGHPIVTVHDCVGTTLDKVGLLRKELNDQFARFYSEDHLGRVQLQVAKDLGVDVPAPPCERTLDLQRIGENPYLFT